MPTMLSRVAVAMVVTAVGCGSEEGEGAPDPAMLACDELGEVGTTVTASATRDESAPEIAFSGEPVTVTLPDGATGFVRVITDEPEHLGILFFDRTDALAAVWSGDTTLPVTSAGENPFCPDQIPDHFDVDFETAGTHFLELGPATSNEVRMIASEAEGHGHEEYHE